MFEPRGLYAEEVDGWRGLVGRSPGERRNQPAKHRMRLHLGHSLCTILIRG